MDGRIAKYEEDVYLWSQQQAEALRAAAATGSNLPVDWENVAEEIESVGRSELRALESALTRIIEHLLKLEYSHAVDPRTGWRTSVLNHRINAVHELEDSPSLLQRLRLQRAYRDGAKLAADGLALDSIGACAIPADCPYSLDQLLDENFWPVNRHGLDV